MRHSQKFYLLETLESKIEFIEDKFNIKVPHEAVGIYFDNKGQAFFDLGDGELQEAQCNSNDNCDE